MVLVVSVGSRGQEVGRGLEASGKPGVRVGSSVSGLVNGALELLVGRGVLVRVGRMVTSAWGVSLVVVESLKVVMMTEVVILWNRTLAVGLSTCALVT